MDSYEVFAGCDVTPLSHPDHHTVGQEFLGHNSYAPNWPTVRWWCAAHDRAGYWLFATDGSGGWHNVSERAIGRTFHQVHFDSAGAFCRFARVPAYDHTKFYNGEPRKAPTG